MASLHSCYTIVRLGLHRYTIFFTILSYFFSTSTPPLDPPALHSSMILQHVRNGRTLHSRINNFSHFSTTFFFFFSNENFNYESRIEGVLWRLQVGHSGKINHQISWTITSGPCDRYIRTIAYYTFFSHQKWLKLWP